MALRKIKCPLCSTSINAELSVGDYTKHLRIFHASKPDFKITCGINGCQRVYNNFGTFKNHLYGMHNDWFSDTTVTEPLENETRMHDCSSSVTSTDDTCDMMQPDTIMDSDQNVDGDLDGDHEMCMCCSPDAMQKSSALFLLGLKEKHKLTQVTVQSIVDSVTTLTQQRISSLKLQVLKNLSNTSISPSQLDELESCFSDYENPFMGLETRYKQLQYFKKNFNLCEPVTIQLGQRHVWKGSGSKRKCVTKDDSFVYIPILLTLQSLLNNRVILSEVEKGHKSSTEILNDFCDGKAFSSHPLFSLQTNSLQIMFYFDELEVCNALGSKAKIHKLGTFYFTLGNLSPKFRSRLSSIQLVALVKSSFITEYGMDAIIRPFVDDMKKLENGVEFEIRGESQKLYGALTIVSADNLGSLALGGFKESCTALKMCRHCMATKDESRTKFLEREFLIRDKESHKRQCALVEQDTTGLKSKEFGINRNSALNELAYFHVCSGALIPDIMHDILEGALQYEVKLMLQVMIRTENYFTLDMFNSRLENIDFGYMEIKNKPTSLSSQTLSSDGNSLKQNASQMWLLGRLLPLVIADLVPSDDEYWELFLQLMEIVDILFSPNTTEDHASYVGILINDHHKDFCRLYHGHSVIPKMHFMVHLPRLMIQFGPLVRHWTMRYEAKHSYFKHLSQTLGNFINLPYTLASRHQQYHCYLHTNTQEFPGWVDEIEIGPGSVVSNDVLQEHFTYLISNIFQANWIKFCGREYKPDAGVVVSVKQDLPIIGRIKDVYLINGKEVAFSATLHSTYYEKHFRAYVLENEILEETVVHYSKLFLEVPIHIRSSQVLSQVHFVFLPHALCTP